MLVAVGLVVLMMTLFTTIFQMATGSLSKQKALAEGDQRVRLVLTLLRGDLNNRTMQDVSPFLPDDGSDPNAPTENADNITNRLGYFYLAENDRDDDTDDILQFTVSVDPAGERYYGAAKALLPDATGNYGPLQGNPAAYPPVPPAQPAIATAAIYWQNQPEFDDQTVYYPNQAGSSNAAEVCWFLRNGNLYRRLLLIRNSGVGTLGAEPSNYPTGPEVALNTGLFYGNGVAAGTARNFYSHFDYSAHYDLATNVLNWHDITDLNPTTGVFAVSRPNYRFGFNQANGLPREFTAQHRDAAGTLLNGANDGKFIGRFTHEETSFINTAGNLLFGYPARVEAGIAPNPMSPAAAPLTYNVVTGKVEEYTTNTFIPLTADQTQTRIAEDLVMTNVLRFDVKVFDEGATVGNDGEEGVLNLDDDSSGVNDDAGEIGWPGSDDGAFFDLGHPGTLGFYNHGSMNTSAAISGANGYCPPHPNGSGKVLYRFDTWHPGTDLDTPGNLGGPFDPPPFRAPSMVIAGNRVRRPLRAIQIRITFFDITSQTERDVTFVQTLKPAS